MSASPWEVSSDLVLAVAFQVAQSLEGVDVLLRWHRVDGLDKPADVQSPVSMGSLI